MADHKPGALEPGGGEWMRTLSPGTLEEARRLCEIRPAWNLVLLGIPLVWLGAGRLALAAPAWPIRLLAVVAIRFCIHAMINLVHDALHGCIFRHRALDRWAGFAMGLPVFFSFTAYRVTHLPHHRFNRGPRDPAEIMNFSRSPAVRTCFFYAWIVAGMVLVVATLPFSGYRSARSGEERRAILCESGIQAVVAGGVAALAVRFRFLEALATVWLLPLLVAMAIGNVRGWAEHMMTLPGHPLLRSRTVTENRLVSFLLLHSNFHLEHHLFPGMPWYNLPRLHRLLRPEYERHGAFVESSYLGFLARALAAGVHGTTRRLAASR